MLFQYKIVVDSLPNTLIHPFIIPYSKLEYFTLNLRANDGN